MENHPDPEIIERLRRLVIAADNVIQAAEKDRAIARALIDHLKITDERVQLALQKIPVAIQAIPDTIRHELKDAANATGEQAARLLTNKFTTADKAARQVADHYQATIDSWRNELWWVIMLSQAVTWTVAAGTYLIYRFIH